MGRVSGRVGKWGRVGESEWGEGVSGGRVSEWERVSGRE